MCKFNYKAICEHHSAYQYVSVILDTNKVVYTYASANQFEKLSDVFFKRHLVIYSLPQGYVYDSFIEWLKSHEDILENILSTYRGRYFDGQNYHGQWDLDAFYNHVDTLDNQNKSKILCYWKAEDWYLEYESGALEDSLKLKEDPSYLDTLLSQAKKDGVIIDRNDLERYLENISS
jgi:hypothetical protein